MKQKFIQQMLIVSFLSLSWSTYSQTHVNISINQPSILQADAGKDTTICLNSSVAIGGMPTATGGTSGYTYIWSPSTGLSDSTIANPIASPTANMTYYVTVTDGHSCTSIDTVNIYVEICSAIDKFTSNNNRSLNIFPNPNKGTFTLIIESTEKTGIINIEIVNSFGQVVYTEQVGKVEAKHESQIDISNYAKGNYIARIKEDNTQTLIKSFIVN